MLSYLFTAIFADGSTIQQTQQDVSTKDPTKSTFFDVTERLKTTQLTQFRLYDFDRDKLVGLDLKTRLFTVGTKGNTHTSFTAQDPSVSIPANAQLRLIYFRKVSQWFTPATNKTGSSVFFHVGYQTTDINGKNVQTTIAVE